MGIFLLLASAKMWAAITWVFGDWRRAAALAAVAAILATYGIADHNRAAYDARVYNAAIAAQLKANQDAINAAHADLMRAADALSLKSLETDRAVQNVDEAARAAPSAGALGLDRSIVRSVNSIR